MRVYDIPTASVTRVRAFAVLALFGLAGCEISGVGKDTGGLSAGDGRELCNGVDDNDNGEIDEGYGDSDEDGIADCMDEEECDGLDNDGDGDIDEDFDADGDGIADCFDEEACFDLIDNDGDGDIDEDCWGSCTAPASTLECEVELTRGSVKCSDGTTGPITLESSTSGLNYEIVMSSYSVMVTKATISNPTD